MQKRIYLFIIINSYCLFANSQINMDLCKDNYLKGKIINRYDIYELDSVKDILLLNNKDVSVLIDFFDSEDILYAIRKIKHNPIFRELISKYARTMDYNITTLYDYAQQYKNTKKYDSYLENYIIIDNIINTIFDKFPTILNISLYTSIGEYGDCYFYQKGYDDYNFIMVSNPVIVSILHGYSKSNLRKYKDDLIGLTIRETGQEIIIPIVINNEYICDIAIIICGANNG